MPVEERDRLAREQRDLLLLDEHRELRRGGARLDVERALARFADGAGAERLDVVELDLVQSWPALGGFGRP